MVDDAPLEGNSRQVVALRGLRRLGLGPYASWGPEEIRRRTLGLVEAACGAFGVVHVEPAPISAVPSPAPDHG